MDGAARIFAADGYEGASMSRIARQAGVSKGTLYNYFDGKAELFTAFVQRECTSGIAVVFDDLERVGAPPEVALAIIGRRILEMLISDTGLLMYRMVVAEAGKFPELADAFFAAGPARALAQMAAWIRRGCDEGSLRVDDPGLAAEQFFALVQTRLCLRRRLGIVRAASEQQIEEVVNSAVRAFLCTYGVSCA